MTAGQGREGTPSVRWQLRASGRVQGVGYRERVRRAATALRLTGAVWNEADGSVTVVVQGPEEFLVRFEQEIRGVHGASDAHAVVRVRALAPERATGPFEVRV